MGADLTLSMADLAVTRDATNSPAWRMVRATLSRNSGKYCFAVESDVNTSDGMLSGVCESSATLSGHVGQTAVGYGVHNVNGRCYTNNTQVGTDINSISAGQYHTFAVDFTAGKIWVGRYIGSQQWSGDPAAGTGERFTFTAGTSLFPAVSLYNNTHRSIGNFKAADLPMAIPAGFSAWE